MWNKRSDDTPEPDATPTPRPTAESRRGISSRALIGESVRVEGTISGGEDLLIEGEVDGTVKLDDNSVTVGRSGRVKADVHGRMLVVEGNVQGDLFAGEQAVVRASGEVRGNITAPRVTLEDGAKFKGSIDMEPKRSRGGETKRSGAPAAAASSRASASVAAASTAGGEAKTGGSEPGGSGAATEAGAAVAGSGDGGEGEDTGQGSSG